MNFGVPWVLALLPAVPLLWGLWLVAAVRGRRRLRSLSRTRTTGPAVVASILLAAAAATAIVSAARPQWDEEDRFIPRRGADLIVVLDVSRSMGARDVAPDRLSAAKTAISATLERLGGDRAGLVIFAGDAIVRSPLTSDLAAASRVVGTLEPGPLLVERGTSADSGLELALDTFDPESEADRLVLFITDGDNLGADPAATAARFAAAGIVLLVIGVGTAEGGTVPVLDSGEVVDLLGADGMPVITRLNEPLLRALAVASGGQYLGNDLSVAPGVVSSRMAGLSSTQFDERPTTLPVERARWFALAAAALAVAATLAERFRRRRHVSIAAIALIAVFAAAGCATEAYKANEEALDAFEAGDYAAAVDLFVQAQAEQPDDPEIALNLAAALHADGRFEEASIAARRALASPSTQWRARAQASIAHHRFASGDLVGALESFREALLENPEDAVSRRDYEVVFRLLAPPEETPGDPQQPSDPGESPTAGPDGPGGEPTPSEPGEQPGDPGEPNDPGVSEEPGEAPGERGLSQEEVEQRLSQLDAEIASLVEAAGEDPTASEALEILSLIEEYLRIASLRAPRGGAPDPNDY